MKYKLTHKTHYKYHSKVSSYFGLACVKPIHNGVQKCQSFELSINPKATDFIERTDFFGNKLHYFTINAAHKELLVESNSFVESLPRLFIPAGSGLSCVESLQLIENQLDIKNSIWQYMIKSPMVEFDEEIKAFAISSFSDNNYLYDCVRKLCNKIYQEFEFKSAQTDVNTSIKTVLKNRVGVCQDFSHLAIACIRSLGFAARYVSGYLETIPPRGKEKMKGTDASHAWISVYIPTLGWCEFDPTNNLIPDERHIITAYGRDYSDVVPLKGIIFSSGGHKLKVEVDVVPVDNFG